MKKLRTKSKNKSIKLASFYGLFAIIIFVTGIVIGLTPFQPPKVTGDDAAESVISFDRVKADLEEIAEKPHPVGSEAHEKVKDYLINSLEEMGLVVEVQDTISYQNQKASRVQNLITEMDGTDPSGTIMLAAHYDSSFVSPGASDDGYGVASLLEAARLLKDEQLKNNIVILITDAEEVGLQGANAFVNQHPLAKDIDVVFNFEARGITGSTVMFETSEDNGNLIKEFKEASSNPVSSSFLNEVYKLIPNDTDLTVFMDAGIDGLNFASAMGLNSYHTTMDSLDFVNDDTLMHHATYAYELAHHFGDVDLTKKSEKDAVYFNVFGHTLISYSQNLVIPLVVIAFLGLLATIYHGMRRKTVSIGGSIAGFLSFIASLVLAFAVSFLAMKIVSAWVGERYWLLQYDYHIANIYFIGFLMITAAVLILFMYLLQKKMNTFHLIIGSLIGWFLLSVVVSFLLPGASFLFVWPLFFGLIGINLVLWKQQDISVGNRTLLYTVFLVPGVVLFTFLVNTIYIALTVDAVHIVMVLASLGLMLFIPAFSRLAGSWKYALGILLIGTGILTYQNITLEATSEHPIGNEVYYFADADTEEAMWGTTAEPDSFTEQFVPKGSEQGEMNQFPAFENEINMYTTKAPFFNEHVPSSELISDDSKDGKRTIVLDVKSPGATIFTFKTKSKLTLNSMKMNDQKLDVYPGQYTEDDPFEINLFGLSEGGKLSITINEGEELGFYFIHTTQDIPSQFSYKERPSNMTTHSDTISISKYFSY